MTTNKMSHSSFLIYFLRCKKIVTSGQLFAWINSINVNFVTSPGKLDLNKIKKKWGVDNVYKVITLICDWMNRDENVQVNGLVVFIDNTDVSMGHMTTLWSQEHGKKIMQFYQVLSISIPMIQY